MIRSVSRLQISFLQPDTASSFSESPSAGYLPAGWANHARATSYIFVDFVRLAQCHQMSQRPGHRMAAARQIPFAAPYIEARARCPAQRWVSQLPPQSLGILPVRRHALFSYDISFESIRQVRCAIFKHSNCSIWQMEPHRFPHAGNLLVSRCMERRKERTMSIRRRCRHSVGAGVGIPPYITEPACRHTASRWTGIGSRAKERKKGLEAAIRQQFPELPYPICR